MSENRLRVKNKDCTMSDLETSSEESTVENFEEKKSIKKRVIKKHSSDSEEDNKSTKKRVIKKRSDSEEDNKSTKKEEIKKEDIKKVVIKKEVNIYDKIDYDKSILDIFDEEFLTSRYSYKLRELLDNNEYKEPEIKKMFSLIWQHCINVILSAFITNAKDLSSTLDKIDNMLTLNKRLFENNTKLRSSDKMEANYKHYTKIDDLNIYILDKMSGDNRLYKELILSWNLLFISLALLAMIDSELNKTFCKSMKTQEYFSSEYNNYLEWFSEMEGGSQFNSKLRILKKQRKIKNDQKDASNKKKTEE